MSPVLLLRFDAVVRLLAKGDAAFIKSCAAIGWKDYNNVRSSYVVIQGSRSLRKLHVKKIHVSYKRFSYLPSNWLATNQKSFKISFAKEHGFEHVFFFSQSWWRHQMEAISALPALCAGNSPVSGEFPAQRPVTRSFDVFFDLRLNERLSKQSWGWWLETQSHPLWRHSNVIQGNHW